MTRWAGIVLAHTAPGEDEMASRLPTPLHPVAGRPLVWHAVSAVAGADSPPTEVHVLTRGDLVPELFQDLAVEVRVHTIGADELPGVGETLAGMDAERILVADSGAVFLDPVLSRLLEAAPGVWVGGSGRAAAALLEAGRVAELFRLPDPLAAPHGTLSAAHQLEPSAADLVVRDREGLATAGQLLRDRIVRGHMRSGVTFLLPDSVLVDVDVRIGRDTMIYPGVILEGQTSIGDETVVGPGCRITDSWIGSGVELKGWNFVANTSVRNRAILEPYVRRGYD